MSSAKHDRFRPRTARGPSSSCATGRSICPPCSPERLRGPRQEPGAHHSDGPRIRDGVEVAKGAQRELRVFLAPEGDVCRFLGIPEVTGRFFVKTRRIHNITMPCLAVELGLSLLVPSAVLAQQDECNELNQRAVKLYWQEKTVEAIPVSHRALDFVRRPLAGTECCVPGIHGICATWIKTRMLVVAGLCAMLPWRVRKFSTWRRQRYAGSARIWWSVIVH